MKVSPNRKSCASEGHTSPQKPERFGEVEQTCTGSSISALAVLENIAGLAGDSNSPIAASPAVAADIALLRPPSHSNSAFPKKIGR
jgi:hypothetical protein